MRDIFTVARKELRAFFRDRVILMQMLILPFVIVFGYSMLMTSMTEGEKDTSPAAEAYSIGAPAEFEDILSELGIKKAESNDTDALIGKIKSKEADLLVVFPDDFKVAEPGAKDISDVSIYYNSDKDSSMELFTQLSMTFTSMQPRIFTFNSDADTTYNLFDASAFFRRFLASILGMMVFMAVFMVCMNLGANSVAGDKEHGFLNTLLITPAKRSSIAIGKSAAILVVAVVAAISASVGMALAMPKLGESMGMEEKISYSIPDYAMILLAVVTGAFVLVAILMIVSSLSKDVKQATTISPVFMLVIMIPSMLGSTDSLASSIEKLGTVNYLIPVWNSMTLLKDIMEVNASAVNVLLTCIVNIAAAALGLFVVGRLFENEKIVNG